MWMTWNLASSLPAFCPSHCKNLNDLYCWSCQCQRVCSRWLSWKRLRNVWLGRMFLWPESEMRVGVSFYVTGSGILWVWPQWNCWNQSPLDCRPHPEGYMCNLIPPTISTLGARRECKSQKMYVMNYCYISGLQRVCLILSGGKVDWTAGWEGGSPGRTLSLRHGLRRQQGEGCVWGSHPLWIQLPGQRLRHLRNHWVIKRSCFHQRIYT